MKSKLPLALGAVVCMHLLSGCGGGGDGSPAAAPAPTPSPSPSPTPPPAPAAAGFTAKAAWTFTLPAEGQSICFDFDTNAQTADCAGKTWDVKATNSRGTVSMYTNSGSSGSGAGGAFGSPFDHTWADLLTWKNATTDPVSGAIPAQLYFPDGASGAFTGTNEIRTAAFEYALNGANDHLLYPNYRVFLITTNNASANAVGTTAQPVFALQVTGYYGGASGTTSGYPSFRWVDRANPGSVRTASVNASSDWVYFDLISGTPSSETGTWQIAFNRYNTKLNGGTSGSGAVAGFVARTPDGLYDSAGKPVAAAMAAATPASTLSYLTASDLAVPASASAWVKDGLSSSLTPASQGSYPAPLDYGWFTYYPTAAAASSAGLPAVAHLISAHPERGTLVRSGEGNSYARMQVASIRYADPAVATSTQTWTINFDVQPASAQ